MTSGQPTGPSVEARRALVLHDRQLVVDLITMTLNHGLFVVRAAHNLEGAERLLAEWHPHLTVIDMGPRQQHHIGSRNFEQHGPELTPVWV